MISYWEMVMISTIGFSLVIGVYIAAARRTQSQSNIRWRGIVTIAATIVAISAITSIRL